MSSNLFQTSSLKSLYPCSSLIKYPLKTSWLSLFKTVWGWEAQTSFAISLRVSPSCSVFCLKNAINLFCNSSSFVMISLDQMNKFFGKKNNILIAIYRFLWQCQIFFDKINIFFDKRIISNKNCKNSLDFLFFFITYHNRRTGRKKFCWSRQLKKIRKIWISHNVLYSI